MRFIITAVQVNTLIEAHLLEMGASKTTDEWNDTIFELRDWSLQAALVELIQGTGQDVIVSLEGEDWHLEIYNGYRE